MHCSVSLYKLQTLHLMKRKVYYNCLSIPVYIIHIASVLNSSLNALIGEVEVDVNTVLQQLEGLSTGIKCHPCIQLLTDTHNCIYKHTKILLIPIEIYTLLTVTVSLYQTSHSSFSHRN